MWRVSVFDLTHPLAAELPYIPPAEPTPQPGETAMPPSATVCDVAVVGAGPSGLAAAILMAGTGLSTVLIAPAAPPVDRRTTALLGASVTLMERLDLLAEIAGRGASMHTMRLIDDTGRLIRAPEVNFRCQEIGLEVFGYNIHNADLTGILETRAAATPGLERLVAKVADVALGEAGAVLTLDDGRQVSARLAVAADGAKSQVRQAAGIAVKTWAYPQSAVVFDITHQRPHEGVSVEFHTRAGPFVLVPLPGEASSVVLVETPETATRLAALDAAELALEVERRSHAIFGRVTITTPRQVFPLTGATATRFGASRVALVGEAGHRFPPIGAQGLNLSLRDVGTLAECLGKARRRGEDIGGPALLAAYDRARKIDVGTRTIGVDVMDRALLSDHLPMQVARSFGLFLADRVAPLRHLMMREGLTPSIGTPRMMRRVS